MSKKRVQVKWDRAEPVPPFVEFSIEDVNGAVPNEILGYDHIRERYFLRVGEPAPDGCIPHDILYTGHCVGWECSPAVLYFQVQDGHFYQCVRLARAFNAIDQRLYHADQVFILTTYDRVPEDERDYVAHEKVLALYGDQLPRGHFQRPRK
jgi:hypothetical protein